MVIKKVSILFPLFIFGITTSVWPDSIKSMNNTTNPLRTMKMEENRSIVQKKTESPKKSKARSQPVLPYSDFGAMMGDTKQDINFSKTAKEKKKPPLTDFLDKVIFSYDFAQNGWMGHFPSFMGVAEARSSNSGASQSHLSSQSPGNQYFEEGRILPTLRLLQPRKDESFKEISMGFRFSFNPLSGHVFLDMNATPSSEARTGIMIPF
jgi:hypothetical protein